MATIAPSMAQTSGDSDSVKVTWPSLLTATTDGVAVSHPQHADLCWQAVGANWGGATLTAQGSNDGTNWFSLTNVSGGAAITFTGDGGKQTIERPIWVRPSLTVAGTAADVTVILHMRKTPQPRF